MTEAEDDDDVIIGVGVDVRRGAHPLQDGSRGNHGNGSEHHCDQCTEVIRVGDVLAHAAVIAGTECLRHRNGKTGADARGKSDDQKADGAGCADTCQRIGTEIASDDHRVHHAVQLLENVSKYHRAAKAQDQTQRLSGSHIFCHKEKLLSGKRIRHGIVGNPSAAYV